MTKPPKEQARDYVWHNYGEGDFNEHNWDRSAEEIWLAGYKAAKQWFSVKDRLPEEGQVVLVIMPKGTVTLGGIRKKTQAWDVFLDMAIWTAEPTHWQPLPEAPKEEK